MANIAVKEFTYKSLINKDTITVSVYADGKLIKDLDFSTVSYTPTSAEGAVQSTAETFGILGPGNNDLYEKAKPGASSVQETITTTVYKYVIKKYGPKKTFIVYQIGSSGEREIYEGLPSSFATDEILKQEAIAGLTGQYPGVESMTLKVPSPPPVPTAEPPIVPPPSPLPDKLKTTDPPKYLPQSKYKKAKRTAGGEFLVKVTGEGYKGFYIETYRKQYFAGETPEQNGVELEKIERAEKVESIPELNKFLNIGISLLTLLQSAFKKQLSQDEIDKGIAKRYFVQDNRDKKISETSEEIFEQGKESIPDFIYKEIPWNISNPADDIVINGAKFQGSESRNKETIMNLEKDIPGISKFVTDYRYLIPEKTLPTVVEQDSVQTQVVKDPYARQQDFRKANFDTK
jgi:hypothetical protein